MKKIFNLIVCSFSFLFIMFGASQMKVEAADDSSGESMRVGVTAIIPENQIDKAQSYFDLLMTPGQEQELEVKLSNSSDEDVTVEVFANTAMTNDNGVVDYSTVETPENRDSSLVNSIADIAMTENEVKVPKQSVVSAKIKVKMPAEAYKGVITGGIYVTEKDEKKKEDDKGAGGVQIKNKFVFVVGLQLRTEESLEGLVPDLVLDKTKILPKQVNFRNFVGINLQNTAPIYIRDLEVDAKIYRDNSKEVLHETKQESLKMAPNSNFNFGVDWENKELQGGKYRAVVKAYSKDYDKEWSWEEEFTIDAELAKQLNEKAVELDKDNSKLYIMIGVGLGILLIIIIILIVYNNAQKKKKQAARRRKKSQSGSSSSKSKKKNKR